MSELERYKQIASILSFRASDVRWKPEEIVAVDLDGEIVKVGPFVSVRHGDSMWEEIFFWRENSTDEYCLYMSEEDWDSWGTHYDMNQMGNDFEIGKVKMEPVVESTWNEDILFPTPFRNRW